MKEYVLIAFGIACYFKAPAQNSWGLVSSLRFDKVLGDGMDNKSKMGYNAGAYTQIQIIKKLSIAPQFLFYRRNVNASPDFKNVFPESALSNFKTFITMNYISVPLLLTYKLNKTLSVNLGPQFSYMLDTNEKLLAGDNLAFNDRDLCITAGAELKIASFKLLGQYDYGLYNLNSIDNGQRSWHSRGLQFGIGWQISR